MSFLSKVFTHTPVDVKNRSGFNQSHSHLASFPVGTLVPLMCKEIIPNTEISLGCACEINLPPMATDFLGKVDFELQAFFVPGRLLFGGFEDVFTHDTGEAVPPGSVLNSYMPSASTVPVDILNPGSLADYLGMKLSFSGTPGSQFTTISNILPFIGYHLIWQEYYRDSRLQVPILFKRNTLGVGNNAISQLPGTFVSSLGTQLSYLYGSGATAQTSFVDGISLFSLRQRAWAKDRFTNATYQPQQGTPTVITAALNSAGTAAELTMGSIFSGYTMDQWKRARNISGRHGEQQFAEFGVYPESYICDRPIFLGTQTINIYNKSVAVTTPTDAASMTPTYNNPFGEFVGSAAGKPMGVGSGSLIDKFKATERGYLYVIASVVPHAYYSSGSENKFYRYRVGDFASPLLEMVGDEPIYIGEISDDGDMQSPTRRTSQYVFGYSQRFGDYKWENDKVSGLLRDGQSLSSFALKRSFGASVTLGSQFIEIPTTALDEVAAATTAETSRFGAWGEVFFKLKTSMPLSSYTIPTLGKLRDSHTVVVENGGKRL